jgi:gamma-glutamylcyclotransferase (GGCT)/AIG2-like uncharacterized protein YtfP
MSGLAVHNDLLSMSSHLYFAYGSNLNREAMADRCPDSEPLGPATLEGWQLTFQGVADIHRRHGARTQGALWRISDRDRDRLDTYEGYPSLYGREKVPVLSAGRELVAATYVMRDEDEYLGLPSPFYLDTIRQGYEQWKLPIIALDFAVAQVKNRLFDLGHHRFEPDGPKRLRPAG